MELFVDDIMLYIENPRLYQKLLELKNEFRKKI